MRKERQLKERKLKIIQMTNTTIIINQYGMGEAPKELRTLLLYNYLNNLIIKEAYPVSICFYAEGVKLLAEQEQIAEQLNILETKGVKIIACKTCLTYYSIENKLKAGKTATMPDIIEEQIQAEKVISL